MGKLNVSIVVVDQAKAVRARLHGIPFVGKDRDRPLFLSGFGDQERLVGDPLEAVPECRHKGLADCRRLDDRLAVRLDLQPPCRDLASQVLDQGSLISGTVKPSKDESVDVFEHGDVVAEADDPLPPGRISQRHGGGARPLAGLCRNRGVVRVQVDEQEHVALE